MSATGQGGDAAQQTQGEGQQNGGGEAAQSPDLGALSTQLQQLAGGQEELRQFLASNPWAQQEAEPDPAQQQEQQSPDVDLSFLDPDSPTFDPERMSERLTGAVGEYVQQAIEQANAPVQEQMAEMRREAEAERLVQEFPDLADPDTANGVVGAANEYATALGMPQLAAEPAFWRLVYAAGRAFDAAAQEGSGDPGAAHVEGGGGAGAGAASNVDPADAIMNAGGKKGSSVLPF